MSGLDGIKAIQNEDPYDRLPVCVKSVLTPEEWMWLPENEKHRVTDAFTQPEVEP